MDKDLFPKPPSFNNLISMKLHMDYSISNLLGMAALLEQTPNLEKISLGPSWKVIDEGLTEVPKEVKTMKLSLPSLRELKFDYYWGTKADLYFLMLFLRDQIVLQKIVLLPVSIQEKSSPVVIAKQTNGFKVVEGYFAKEDILQ